MRYFTLNWWCGIQEDYNEDPVSAYNDHWEEIRPKLPPDFLFMKDSISLHDARVREINLNHESSTVELIIEDYEGKRRLYLRYSGLKSLHSTADPSIGLPGPFGYGDLGYDEIYIEDGLFLHCILFSSGIEIQILFSQFDFDLQDSGQILA